MSAAEARLLRLPEVVNRCGIRRSKIYELIAEGKFPKQIQLGPRSVAWDAAAIENWIQERIATPYQRIAKQATAEARASA